MKQGIFRTAILIATLCLSQISFIAAQTATQSAAMQAFTLNYIKEINDLPRLGTSEQLMPMFSTSFHNDVIISDLDKKMKAEVRNYFTTADLFNRYTEVGVTVDYTAPLLVNSFDNDTIGYVTFQTKYTLAMNGIIYRRGEQTISYHLEKTKQKWEIISGITFIQYKEIDKADCLCNVFSKDNQYIVSLRVPKGDEYKTTYHTIKFNKVAAGQTEVWIDGSLYVWTLDDEAYITTPDKRDIVLHGRTEADVVNIILTDLYKQSCFKITFAS